METEETILQKLTQTFPAMEGKCRVARPRRMFAAAPLDRIEDVLNCCKKDLGFTRLCMITGTDEGAAIGLMYNLTTPDGKMLNVSVSAPKDNPEFRSMSGVYANSVLYEREAVDLLGAKMAGLPAGKRYPLPDEWPAGQHPLRKDWKKGA